MLDYEYIKHHYKLIAVDLNGQKELDADTKAIQKLKFIGQPKNIHGFKADIRQTMIF